VAETLASCHRESIRIADDHGIRSIAFPAISTGAFGYPVEEAASVSVPATISALLAAAHVQHVRFVLFDRQMLQAFAAAFEQLHRSGSISPLHIERKSL